MTKLYEQLIAEAMMHVVAVPVRVEAVYEITTEDEKSPVVSGLRRTTDAEVLRRFDRVIAILDNPSPQLRAAIEARQ